MNDVLPRLMLEIAQARPDVWTRREMRLADDLDRLCRAVDAWRDDMEQRPHMRPGEVIRPSFADMMEALRLAQRSLKREAEASEEPER